MGRYDFHMSNYDRHKMWHVCKIWMFFPFELKIKDYSISDVYVSIKSITAKFKTSFKLVQHSINISNKSIIHYFELLHKFDYFDIPIYYTFNDRFFFRPFFCCINWIFFKFFELCCIKHITYSYKIYYLCITYFVAIHIFFG